jgi:hypothetical protein
MMADNFTTFVLLFLGTGIVIYCLSRFIDRILYFIKYQKPSSRYDRQEPDEICSSLVQALSYSPIGEYDNNILVDACQTELGNVCEETSEVASILVENAGEMTESLGAVVETTVGHVVEALTSFHP